MFETAALLGIAAGKTFLQVEAAQSQEQALDILSKEEELAATEQSIQRDKQLEKIIATQRAEGAARGIAPTSASLAAIGEDTFNQFAEDMEGRRLNLKLKENAINQQRENIEREKWVNVFGNLFDVANRINDLRVPSVRKVSSGKEIDQAFEVPSTFKTPGILDLKTYHQEELNYNLGF